MKICRKIFQYLFSAYVSNKTIGLLSVVALAKTCLQLFFLAHPSTRRGIRPRIGVKLQRLYLKKRLRY